jgi:hypothetical protein
MARQTVKIHRVRGNSLHIPGWVDAQWANCYLRLGLATEAIAHLDHMLGELPEEYRRDRGVFLAIRARAQLAAGEPAASTDDAADAITYLDQTGSARTRQELAELRTEANQWSATSEGSELIEMLDAVA